MKDGLKELRWLRGLVAERDGHGGDIPVWLALEWIDDAIKRSAAEPTGDPNPLDPANNQFRLCPNGHAPYSRSFDGCPSCKVVAMARITNEPGR